MIDRLIQALTSPAQTIGIVILIWWVSCQAKVVTNKIEKHCAVELDKE